MFNAGTIATYLPLWDPSYLTIPPRFFFDDRSDFTLEETNRATRWFSVGNPGGTTGWVGSGSGARPVYSTSELGGKPVFVFTNASFQRRFFMANSFPDVSESIPYARETFKNQSQGWIFALGRRDNTSAGAHVAVFFPTSAFNTTRLSLAFGYGSTPNSIRLGARRLDADSFASLGSTIDLGTDWALVLGTMNWGTGEANIYINGELDVTNPSLTSTGNTSNTDGNITENMTLGSLSNLSEPMEGRLAACLIGRTLPSADEIDKLFGCYAHRYGLTSLLPSNHPYKNFPPVKNRGT